MDRGDRLASAASYRSADAADDPALQALAEAAARALGAPVAGLSLMGADEQHYLARVQVPTVVLPRHLSLCTHTVSGGRPVAVGDTLADPRFADHPLVTGEPHLRAYAGVPLFGRDGLPVGSLCVLDVRPRGFGAADVAVLERLARAAGELLELHRRDAGAGLAGRDVLAESLRLRRAVDDGELRVHYQPVADLRTGRVAAVEALVRWQHPEHGLLPPARFVPVAEASGLVVALGRHVLTEACRQVAAWRAAGPGTAGLRLAVNVSGRQLAEPGVVGTVHRALEEAGLPPGALTLELTETALVHGGDVQPALRELRAGGVRLALDDFGTGYSSLAYLRDFPVDELKVDRGFTASLGESARSVSITAAAVGLAHELGCEVVVEGVETPAQLAHVAGLGARYAQGYPRAGAGAGTGTGTGTAQVAPSSQPAAARGGASR
ncbi:sensor domain-containing phosphodiesterase [Kineococcus indalonis]|uniref:sensor domain-containing phosphodiesterase n=1 Tax=Kineococcus indalonis TaxID=2696566 RepID=UPI00141256AF|nr:EAL domain-containing protein [Kineococcus indalonis]NAZ88493.1 EAL domain-containing protein [Kineococcus indalonis]